MLDSARTAAAQLGAEHVQLPVDRTGRVSTGALEPAMAGGAAW
ncbi:hypothetical protein [Actinomyces ruminis]|nr:hypothetical protein [Actinomyces ruminis]